MKMINHLWRWQGINHQGKPARALWENNRLQVFEKLQSLRIMPLTLRRCVVKKALWHPRYSGQIIRQLAALLQAGSRSLKDWHYWLSNNRMHNGRRCYLYWLRI